MDVPAPEDMRTVWKVCTKCARRLPLNAFGRTKKRGKSVSLASCRDCRATRRREWYQENRDRQRAYQRAYEATSQRRSWLKHKYGMTPEQFEALHDAQRGLCAICFQPQHERYRYLDVDHDHATGRIRGLLCRRCNTTLGLLGDGDPAVVNAFLRYVATTARRE